MPLDQKWKRFERLVAALHRAEAAGATVTWNTQVNGRQFDVVVRGRQGIYDYLTVIECRDLGRPVEISDVDAFVTKSKDVQASKAVMVASSGFQRGALDVGQRHGVVLMTLAELERIPDDLLTGLKVPILRVDLVRLVQREGGEQLQLSVEPDRMYYEVRHTILRTPDGSSTSLHALFEHLLLDLRTPGEPLEPSPTIRQYVLPPRTTAASPAWTGDVPVCFLLVTCSRVDADVYRGGLDPTVVGRVGKVYRFENVITGDAVEVRSPIFETVLEAGCFYRNPTLGFAYYCEAVSDGNACLYLIESYQHGELFQAKFKQPINEAYHYEEITESAEIVRLRALLNRLL